MLKTGLKDKKPKKGAPVNLDDSPHEMNDVLSREEDGHAADI